MKKLLAVLLLALVHLAPSLQADTVVVFNEIMYHPATGETNLEWVELYNQLAVDVDLSGWSLAGGIDYTFPANSVIAGGGYLVVAIDPAALAVATGLIGIHGPFTGRLSNNGETLELRDNNGRVRDRVSYGVEGDWPVPPDGSGVSLAKYDRETASEPPANWVASAEMGGTPGEDNFPLVGGVPPTTELVDLGAAWRYDAAGTDLGTAWREPTFSDATWASRTAVEERTVPSVYSTGVADNGTVIAAGSPDPHYQIVRAAQGPINVSATVIQNHPAWLANDSQSSFIGVVNPGSANVNGGEYWYRTTFDLQGMILSTVQLTIRLAVDNEVLSVLLNNQPTGISHVGFDAFSGPFTLSSGFDSGLNTLEFRTTNYTTGANPAGFRALLGAGGLAASGDAALPTGRATYYFRKVFSFPGNPAQTALKLNALVADGVVIYLNGTEVYRQNMPAGPVTYATPALAAVPNPALTGLLGIPAEALVPGDNVLAAEVHMASGNSAAALFAAELVYTPVAGAGLPLAFNEVSSGTNGTFWIELVNTGAQPMALDGYRLWRDGAGTNDQDYIFPSGTTLAGGGFLALTNSTLGFLPELTDKLILFTAAGDQVIDGVVVKRRPRARHPDGVGPWLIPEPTTPGAPNQFALRDEIVINEIMYHARPLAPINGLPAQESPEAWIELHNRSGSAVDLTGWELDGGIRYTFEAGETIPAGGYLVVADDAAYVQAMHSSIRVVGNFGGRLSRKGERIVLKDAIGNPADEVHYHEAAPWPEWADGGGSSLELRDPGADNSRPESWAESDETGQLGWATYTYRAVAATSSSGSDGQWRDFVMGLLSGGECLIDDLHVVETPDTAPVEMVANGDFEGGISGWRPVGTHGTSQVIVDPDNPGNHVLHLVATGPMEHMHNHVEITLAGGRSVVNGREYEVSYRAKWLRGNNLLNTHLYFNRVARSTALATPLSGGTPGAQNSRWESNLGPTYAGLRHEPAVPQPNEPVTVTVSAQDPDGIQEAWLSWSTTGINFTRTPLVQEDGLYRGTIPPQAAGTIVQFYVEAEDNLGVTTVHPAGGPDSGALYVVEDGQANFSRGHNVRIIVSPPHRDLLHDLTNVMSNAKLPGTVIYDEHRPYYNVGVRLKGSQRGRWRDQRVSFHLTFPADDPFRGVHPVMLVDRSGQGDATTERQTEIIIKHMLQRAGDIPGTQSDLSYVIAPFSRHTSSAIFFPRHEDEFIETGFADGGEGTLWEMELIYYPTTANAAGYKLPTPDNVSGLDVQNLGDDPEPYRYNFIIKNHRDADHYGPFITMAKAWSLSGAALEQQTGLLMDIDQCMRSYAFITLCGVGDMYTFGNNHNWMFYLRPSDQKMLYFPWDMDFSFSRGATEGLVGNMNFANIVNLIPHRRLFYGHIQDLIGSVYNTAYMTPWINHYNSFVPEQNFTQRISYIQTRASSALSQINSAGGNAAFAIQGTNFITTSNNLVTLTGTAPVAFKTLRVNGGDYPLTWASVSQWRLTVPVLEASNVLELVGYDMHDQPLTNLSQTVTVVYQGEVPDPQGWIVFNEIMYHSLQPGAGFVELYNRSPNFSFDLSGWRINGLDYTFPSGSILTNGQYLVLAENRAGYAAAYGSGVPAPFDQFDGLLKPEGETLTLLKPGAAGEGEIEIDKVRYENVAPWVATADGQGASLQLIDVAQDNSRASNWSDGAGWRYFEITKAAGFFGFLPAGVRLALAQAGELYIDNISLVLGESPDAGPNLVENGDLESGTLAPWIPLNNHAGSVVSSEAAYQGTYSLKMIATGAGDTGNNVANTNMTLNSASVYTLSFYYLPAGNNRLKYRVGSTLQDFTVGVDVSLVLSTPGRANTTVATLPPYDPVWLNEVAPQNDSGLTDGAGDLDPWIELYNSGPDPVSLEGYYLTDNYDSNLTQWPFPAGAVLAPGEFKLVWLDGEPGESTADEWHAGWRLNPGTGSVALVRLVDGVPQITDYLNYSALLPEESYGDFPDGQPFKRVVQAARTPGAPNQARPADVYINEWLASNTTGLTDPADGNYEDWFELYNAGAEPVDLTGYYLTDNLNNKAQFAIPAGYVIPPGGFLLVWADNDPQQNVSGHPHLHTSFALNRDGESIGLYSPQIVPVDEITFGVQTNDVSEGRFPDGSTAVTPMAIPTPGSANVVSSDNTAPTLDPIPNVTLVLGQTLDLLVTANDAEVPPQALAFTLNPTAPAGVVLENVSPTAARLTWIPALDQAPSTNSLTITVLDNGSPRLSDQQTFTVVVLLPPAVGIGVADGTVNLSFPAIEGKTYRILYTERLDPVDWRPLLPDQVAEGPVLEIDDPIGLNPQRFYQVQQVD